MGIMKKLFGNKAEKKVEAKTVSVEKIEESKTTLRYDEQIITAEAFRAGVKQGARIRAFKDGIFIPLKELGDDLLIFDVDRNGYIPLQKSDNEQHQDIKRYVFGG